MNLAENFSFDFGLMFFWAWISFLVSVQTILISSPCFFQNLLVVALAGWLSNIHPSIAKGSQEPFPLPYMLQQISIPTSQPRKTPAPYIPSSSFVVLQNPTKILPHPILSYLPTKSFHTSRDLSHIPPSPPPLSSIQT